MAQFKAQKRATYINFKGKIYRTNNNWEDKTFTLIEDPLMNNSGEWVEVGDFESIEEAYYAFIGLEIKRKNEKKDLKIEKSEIQATEWDMIKDLKIIPATEENIKTVLNHLHNSNYGSWVLPQMSVSYSANQYDCEGVTATAIKFDQPVNGITKFKTGGRRLHLTQYQSL